MSRKIVLLVLLGGSLLALLVIRWCPFHRKASIIEDTPVARVYDQYLYKSDLDHLAAETASPETYAKMVDQYIQRWVIKQLFIAEAEAHSSHRKKDIERRVIDYRYELLVHNFIEELVNFRLNKEISDTDIEDYYQSHKEDFVLRHNIFRGKFVVLPKDAPDKAKLRMLLMGKTAAKRVALRTYCLQFAKDYSLDETTWLSWEECIQGTPFSSVKDKAKLLSIGALLLMSDEKYFYYFKIDECRLVNEVSPLIFVRDQIIDILIYKRKVELAHEIQENMLRQAQNNNNCVIYEH